MRVGDYRGQISGGSPSLYSAARRAVQRGDVVMDDRSRTAFHTINNRYRRPVVNPELSSRGAGRRWKSRRRLLSRDQEAIGRVPPCLRVLAEDSLQFSYYRSTLGGKCPVGRDPNQFIPKIRDYSPFQKHYGKKMSG